MAYVALTAATKSTLSKRAQWCKNATLLRAAAASQTQPDWWRFGVPVGVTRISITAGHLGYIVMKMDCCWCQFISNTSHFFPKTNMMLQFQVSILHAGLFKYRVENSHLAAVHNLDTTVPIRCYSWRWACLHLSELKNNSSSHKSLNAFPNPM